MQKRPLVLVLDAVGAGVLTLYPIWRAPRWIKGAYVAVPAAAAGTAMAAVQQGRDHPPSPRRTALYAAVAAAGIGAASWVSIGIDKRIERVVARTGVARPRVVMAVGAAVLMAATEYADMRREPDEAPGAGRDQPGRLPREP